MSDVEPAKKVAVGRQLRRLRKRRRLTQVKLGLLVGVRDRTVSAIEHGVNSIQSGRRSLWEEALGLVPGTITEAYETGSEIEVSSTPAAMEPAQGAYAELIALLTARVADVAEKVEDVANDDSLDRLTARVKRVEEHLDEERRARELLERTVAELTKRLPHTS